MDEKVKEKEENKSEESLELPTLYSQCETCEYGQRMMAKDGLGSYKCSADGQIKDDDKLICQNYTKANSWDEVLEKETEEALEEIEEEQAKIDA